MGFFKEDSITEDNYNNEVPQIDGNPAEIHIDQLVFFYVETSSSNSLNENRGE